MEAFELGREYTPESNSRHEQQLKLLDMHAHQRRIFDMNGVTETCVEILPFIDSKSLFTIALSRIRHNITFDEADQMTMDTIKLNFDTYYINPLGKLAVCKQDVKLGECIGGQPRATSARFNLGQVISAVVMLNELQELRDSDILPDILPSLRALAPLKELSA